MTVEYRPFTPDDIEQSAHVEAVAFYNRSTPELVDLRRQLIPPDWTVGAFIEGRLVADVRTTPMRRYINGGTIGFGAVGPVACLSAHRRQGHVAKLLRLALERMREKGQWLSGLYTPHDALYARYGWERAEGRKRYEFSPKDVHLRSKGASGSLATVSSADWRRLDAIYNVWAAPRNGPLRRVEPWWTEAVLAGYDGEGLRADREAFVWVDSQGADQGYLVYEVATLPKEGRWAPHDIWVRDLVALSADAYTGLWLHLLTHDLAARIVAEVSAEDPFSDLVEDPWKLQVLRAEGAMIRVVDVERALGARPYCGETPVSFTLGVADEAAPWNKGVWRIQAAEGTIAAERTDGEPELELSANALAPLFTGHMRPDTAASVGLLRVHQPDALVAMSRAFAVTHAPYCGDNY